MFTICPIKPVKTNNYNNFQQQRKEKLRNDVFIRTTPDISFKGTEQKERNSFIEWADKTDFIKNQLQYIISNPSYKIGTGSSHIAYSIPGNDEYILRTQKNQETQNFEYEEAIIKDTEDKNLGINIGQEVAIIEVPVQGGRTARIEVLKKQKGEGIGIPPIQTLFIPGSGVLRNGELPYESFERIPIKLQILEPISTKKNNITDGQKIKFKVKQNVKHNHHVILTAGTIVEGTVETFMPRGMNGIPGVIILDDFEIPGLEKSKLKSTYIKRGPDLSLCVFPLKWALTFLPPTGSLTNFIVGGNAKISTKDTIQVFYYPAWN